LTCSWFNNSLIGNNVNTIITILGIDVLFISANRWFTSRASILDDCQVKPSAEKAIGGPGKAVLCFSYSILASALHIAEKDPTIPAESNDVWYTFQCSPIEILDIMTQFLQRSVAMQSRATLARRHAG
jgi:hypothetical protein